MMISHRAAALAAVVAFVVGLLGSLSLRPAGGAAPDSTTAVNEQGGSARRVHWRMPISIASTSPVLGEAPVWMARDLLNASGGALQLDVYDPGELVPAFSITDAVRDGKVPVGHIWLGYDQGKIPVSTLFAATPFGLEPWEYLGWWYEGGGAELADEIYAGQTSSPYCVA